MLARLYANNFRCLVAFEARFDSFCVLCGPNGAGKSSVFDAIDMLRKLATGEALLGGETERDIPRLELTGWLESKIQEFEIDVQADGHLLRYLIHLEQVTPDHKPRVIREKATCDDKVLYERNLDGVFFQKASGVQTSFPLDWRQAALGAIQPAADRREIELLKNALVSMVVVRPSPRSIEADSKGESTGPSLYMDNLLSWYRYLAQEQEWTDALRDSLQQVWPDFRSFKLVDVGLRAKALQLRFDGPGGAGDGTLLFHQLSDGEKALIALYMTRAALETGAIATVLIDEPDNYVGLPELQPWVLAMRELLDESHQAVLISHHPEVLGNASEEFGRYLWRDNHSSPTRFGPLKAPTGLTPGEAVARGWVDA